MQAQFPLHSGRLGGIFGRVLVSLLGVAVATLSVTGIIVWSRKRRARVAARPISITSNQAPGFAPEMRSESM
jgi:uncharacterized iron-regulated membrane protein